MLQNEQSLIMDLVRNFKLTNLSEELFNLHCPLSSRFHMAFQLAMAFAVSDFRQVLQSGVVEVVHQAVDKLVSCADRRELQPYLVRRVWRSQALATAKRDADN